MASDLLSEADVTARLESLNAHSPGEAWTLQDGKLTREFVFRDFVEAFGFMTKAAIHAQALDHHPEWCNVYKKVRVQLTTHSAGGLTALDFSLAERMDTAAG